eukprot:IDg23506t1
MDSPTDVPVWSLGYAASVAVEAPWALKLGSEPSGVGGDRAYPFARNGLRYPVEVLVGGDGRTGVDGRKMRRGRIYAASQARAVRSMFFAIEWDVQVCAGLPRGVLQLPSYAINA